MTRRHNRLACRKNRAGGLVEGWPQSLPLKHSSFGLLHAPRLSNCPSSKPGYSVSDCLAWRVWALQCKLCESFWEVLWLCGLDGTPRFDLRMCLWNHEQKEITKFISLGWKKEAEVTRKCPSVLVLRVNSCWMQSSCYVTSIVQSQCKWDILGWTSCSMEPSLCRDIESIKPVRNSFKLMIKEALTFTKSGLTCYNNQEKLHKFQDDNTSNLTKNCHNSLNLLCMVSTTVDIYPFRLQHHVELPGGRFPNP